MLQVQRVYDVEIADDQTSDLNCRIFALKDGRHRALISVYGCTRVTTLRY